MSKTPAIKLFITGTDEYVADAFAEIFDTYLIDKNIVTKGTRDGITIEYSGDRAVCMVPIYYTPDKQMMFARAWYIIGRWDVTSVVTGKGLLVRDIGRYYLEV